MLTERAGSGANRVRGRAGRGDLDSAPMPSIFEPEWEQRFDDPPLRHRSLRVGTHAGSRELGATVFEIDPGGRVSPLHVHHANEELLIVLSGRPTVRTRNGEREVETGEVVAFPRGAPRAATRSSTAPTRRCGC